MSKSISKSTSEELTGNSQINYKHLALRHLLSKPLKFFTVDISDKENFSWLYAR